MARKNVGIARKLRRTATDAESLLWHHARDRQIGGAKFRRQHPIAGYIVDFVCTEAALIVEIDGGQHNESHADEARTQKLNKAGYRVLRFWNNEVLQNIEGVLETIVRELENAPHPSLSPEGRG